MKTALAQAGDIDQDLAKAADAYLSVVTDW